MKKDFVDTNNSNSRPDGKYARVIGEIAKEGICPFCSENLTKYHKKPLAEKKYWWVTTNMYPYTPSLHHCLFIHKHHISHLNEITPEAWAELQAINNEETDRRSITGGALIIRFGETRYTGASVKHLHAHIVQSDPDCPDYDNSKGLIMRIG